MRYRVLRRRMIAFADQWLELLATGRAEEAMRQVIGGSSKEMVEWRDRMRRELAWYREPFVDIDPAGNGVDDLPEDWLERADASPPLEWIRVRSRKRRRSRDVSEFDPDYDSVLIGQWMPLTDDEFALEASLLGEFVGSELVIETQAFGH